MIPSGSESRTTANIPGWLVALGGVPLLAAMAIEFVGVIARNLGVPLHGTIELVQVSVLLSSSVAIVIATLSRAHAKVRVLLSRVRGTPGRILRVAIAVGGTVFFLVLFAGSVWIIADLWGGAEHTEILRVPYLPLRCFAATAMLVTAAIYAQRIFRRGDSG